MGSELHEEMGLWSPKEGCETSTNHPIAGSYRAIGLDLQGASPEQAASLKQQLEQTKAKLESNNDVQLATLTKHNLVGNLLYGTVFNYFALNDLQDRIAAQSSDIINYRLPSYGTFSTKLQPQYWFGLPRNVAFGGLSMDIDKSKHQRISKTNNKDESIAFSQSVGARMSAMEHLVPEQMFSTEQNKAQGISAVKALAIASQQGQKIWTINKTNVNLALERINLGADAETDIRNAVNAGKIAAAHETRINFNGWVGEGYTLIDPNTGASGYIISGGGNGGETAPASDFEWSGLLPYIEEVFNSVSDSAGGLLSTVAKLLGKATKVLDTISMIVELAENCTKDEGLTLLIEYAIFGLIWTLLASGFIGFFVAWPLLMPLIIAFLGIFISSLMFAEDGKTCKKNK